MARNRILRSSYLYAALVWTLILPGCPSKSVQRQTDASIAVKVGETKIETSAAKAAKQTKKVKIHLRPDQTPWMIEKEDDTESSTVEKKATTSINSSIQATQKTDERQDPWWHMPVIILSCAIAGVGLAAGAVWLYGRKTNR